MNNRRIHLPHPFSIYLGLLLVVLIASWIGSVYEVRSVNRNSDLMISNLLDYQGLRWFFRNVSTCMADAPVGNALLLLMGFSLVPSSGLWSVLKTLLLRSAQLSYKQRYALLLSLAPLTIYLLMLLYGIFFGHRVLLGITGTLHDSPLVIAWCFLTFLLLAIPSVSYGLASGTFQKGRDIMDGLCRLLITAASFFVTLFIASVLVNCIEYSGLFRFLGMGDSGLKLLSAIIYWLPLPLILVNNARK